MKCLHFLQIILCYLCYLLFKFPHGIGCTTLHVGATHSKFGRLPMANRKAAKPGKTGTHAVRVNVGGKRCKDIKGHIWESDREYTAGSWGCLDAPTTDILTTNDPVTGTDDPTLFQSIRVGEQLRYRFDVPNSAYNVRLLFAEIYWESSDAEQQEVRVQGKKILSNFNIFDQVGHDTAFEKTVKARVTDRKLEVHCIGQSLPMHSGARISGIEVVELAQE